jgi:hypothetical protein
MVVVYYVWRWRGTAWRLDDWHPRDPEGHRTEAAAQARVEELKGYHRKRTGKEPYPPPCITGGMPPRWTPRRKEKKHHFTPAELMNGHTHGPPIVLREGVCRR